MENQIKKRGGRIKGTPNKITKDIRESYQLLIENNLDRLEDDIRELSPKDRIEILIRLTEYVVPKLQRTQIQNDFDLIGLRAEFVDR
jgi:DNA primase catalytic subunit